LFTFRFCVTAANTEIYSAIKRRAGVMFLVFTNQPPSTSTIVFVKMSVQVEEIPMPAEETQVVKPIVNATRLYVNNVSYLTTENDIIELLKDFEV
jgi:RNA recognition motif-containing protein